MHKGWDGGKNFTAMLAMYGYLLPLVQLPVTHGLAFFSSVLECH
jgi:hypothetical protein